ETGAYLSKPIGGEARALNEETVRLSTIGQIVRRRWRLLVVGAAVGALLGAGASVVLSPGYNTSSSVALQGPREKDELATEAQVAMSSIVLDRTAAALQWGVSGADLRGSVSAGVLDGNVIEIRGTAKSPERAQQLTDRVTEEYMTFSAQLTNATTDASAQVRQEQREKLRQQLAQTDDRISQLIGSAPPGTTSGDDLRNELEQLRSGLDQAMKKLEDVEATSSQAKMFILGRAELPSKPASPTMVQLIGGGAGL